MWGKPAIPHSIPKTHTSSTTRRENGESHNKPETNLKMQKAKGTRMTEMINE